MGAQALSAGFGSKSRCPNRTGVCPTAGDSRAPRRRRQPPMQENLAAGLQGTPPKLQPLSGTSAQRFRQNS